MLDVVTFGETMILMTPDEDGSLKYVNKFTKRLGGAESNFSIALSRLGFDVGWISRLGADSFGDYIEFFVRGEGVDVSQVKRNKDYPTGLMIKERHSVGESKVFYYRKESAASQLTPEDLDEEYISQAKFLHITGITPALSESCKETIYKAIEIAHDNDVKVVFDPNLRLKLWDREKMKRVILDICTKVDILLPGVSEGQILLDKEEPEEIIDEFLELGPEIVVLKIGPDGAIAANSDFKKQIPTYEFGRVIDTVGAGDGFAAGFVAGLLKEYDLIEAVKLANAVGASATTVKGDIEGYPTWDQLQVILGNKEEIDR